MAEVASSSDASPMNEIRIQNEEYFKVFDFIAKDVSKEDQIEILVSNGQLVPDTDAQVNKSFTIFKLKSVNKKISFWYIH